MVTMPLLALKVNPMVDARAPLLTYERAAEAQRQANLRGLRRQVGQQMGAGDYLGAAQTAMAGGDIQTGVALQQQMQDRRLKLLDAMITAGKRADTPEAYQAYVQQIEGAFGPGSLGKLAQWENRLGGLTQMERLKERLTRAQIAKAEAHDPRPSAIRTWEYLQKLPPKQQAAFLKAKKAGAPTTNIYTGNIPLTSTSQSAVQKDLMSTYNRLRRIGQQRATYNPKWQRIGIRGKMWGLDLKARFTNLSPKARKDLIDYSTFRATAFEDLNQVIADMAGAAVSDQEYKRQLAVLPNPGTGLFDGDSPPVYEAKMARLHREARMAIARYNYWLKFGLPSDPNSKPWDIGHLGPADPGSGADSMESVIDREAQKIMADLRAKNPKMPDENIRQATRRKLSSMFGVQFDGGK